MKICKSLEDLTMFQAQVRGLERTLALIPTMGALHEGHLDLMRKAKLDGHICLATIFVNPMQFAAHEDLEIYPKTFDEDVKKLRSVGVEGVFAPTNDLMYPKGESTRVNIGELGQKWEGMDRPHFFEGVATIVAKLLIIGRADTAYFGEKDFQQLQIIKKLTKDLLISTKIIGCSTRRDPDGLALSSRNTYLTSEERKIAPYLQSEMITARDRIISGQEIDSVLKGAKENLKNLGFSLISYLAYVDAETMTKQDALLKKGFGRLIAAATLGSTRLIDNLAI